MKKIFIIYLIGVFIFNFIWEMSQVIFYKPHFSGTLDLILVHLRATVGDAILSLIIYALMSLIVRDTRWILKSTVWSFILISFFGFIFAVAIEKYALLTGRWEYSELMFIVPIIKVGLSPVLQLTILTPLVTFITRKIILEHSIEKKKK